MINYGTDIKTVWRHTLTTPKSDGESKLGLRVHQRSPPFEEWLSSSSDVYIVHCSMLFAGGMCSLNKRSRKRIEFQGKQCLQGWRFQCKRQTQEKISALVRILVEPTKTIAQTATRLPTCLPWTLIPTRGSDPYPGRLARLFIYPATEAPCE